MEIISQWSFCLPALYHCSLWTYKSLQSLHIVYRWWCSMWRSNADIWSDDAGTLLQLRICGRVLTFRRSSNLSTGFGIYDNKQWMEYGRNWSRSCCWLTRFWGSDWRKAKIQNLVKKARWFAEFMTKKLVQLDVHSGQRKRKKRSHKYLLLDL